MPTVKDLVPLPQLTKLQAEKLCTQAMQGLVSTRSALTELEQRKGWASLGYGSMGELLRVRFKVGQRAARYMLQASRSMQRLLPHLPEGTDPDRISERALRLLDKIEQDKVPAVVNQLFEAGDGPIDTDAVKKVINFASPHVEPEPDAILDEIGDPVPPKLGPVFEQRAEFYGVLAVIKQLKTKINDLIKGPAGRELARRITSIEIDRSNLHTKLSSSMPYALCTNCKGQRAKCTVCNGQGWMTQTQHDNAWKG